MKTMLIAALLAVAALPLTAQWSDVDEAARAVDESRWGDARRSSIEAIEKCLSSDARTNERTRHDLAWASKYLAISESHFAAPADAEYDWYIAIALDSSIDDNPPAFARSNLRLTQAKPIADGIQPPQPIERRSPEFPKRARLLGVQQEVVVEVVIDTNGAVRQPRLVSANVDPSLAYAFMDCVRSWRFKPAMRNGKPVAVVLRQSVNFRNPYAAPVLQPRE